MPPEARPRVLVLESSPLQRILLRRALRDAGCEAVLAASPDEADALIPAARPGLALVELLREEGNGFEDGVRLMERHGIPVVLMSASGRATDAPWAARLGFVHTLARPFGAAALAQALARTSQRFPAAAAPGHALATENGDISGLAAAALPPGT